MDITETEYACKIAYLPETFNYIGDLSVMENIYFNFMVNNIL